jgi:hypothetical protein
MMPAAYGKRTPVFNFGASFMFAKDGLLSPFAEWNSMYKSAWLPILTYSRKDAFVHTSFKSRIFSTSISIMVLFGLQIGG